MVSKSVEERLTNTDNVFKQMKDEEERARQAKKDRLRQAREAAQSGPGGNETSTDGKPAS